MKRSIHENGPPRRRKLAAGVSLRITRLTGLPHSTAHRPGSQARLTGTAHRPGP